MNVRLLPYEVADGPGNMARDEILLQTAVDNQIASLRFYGWSEATVSLGYFQPAAVRWSDRRLMHLPWVRRPTGGGTLVHDREVTYALALPPQSGWQAEGRWIVRMHDMVRAALGGLGARQLRLVEELRPSGAGLCFQQHSFGDLLSDGSKVAGSAQRKHRQALLQHGGILLAQSPHTPFLPGLQELEGVSVNAAQVQEAVAAEFAKTTGWAITPGAWTEDERRAAAQLIAVKYRSAWWNERR
ncbi:MAG: lipoate--protein ligase family protein [Gemmataceae bacterium]|nr:lipoate--protein ligase family protein [Gemmataceae bacterium]